MSFAKHFILGTALCFGMATQSWAQMDVYGTETSIGATNGYTSTSQNIDLDISVTIDEMSSWGTPFPQDTPTPFGMENLSVNNRTIDTAADCSWQGNTTLECQYAYALTAAERNSSSLTFSGNFGFDASYQSANNGPFVYQASDGQNRRSIPLTLNRSVGTNPNCTTEANPLMPTTTNPGNFVFILNAAGTCTNQIFWIDPPVAAGYAYAVTGANFTKVKMPSLASVNDTDGYEIRMPSNMNPTQFLLAGEEYTFSVPTPSFRILGINPALTLDPNDSQAFPAGIELTTPTGSQVTITQTPITEEYPPISNIGSNQKPLARGPALINAVGQPKIHLDSSASSDADGDALTYRWVQIGGPPVTFLSSQTIATPHTSLPTPGLSPQYVTFEVVANDGAEDSKPFQVVAQTR